jgi:hypothetical protein
VNREIPSLKWESAQHAILQSKNFLSEIDRELQMSHTDWVLNTPYPTALDAHAIVFVARLRNAGRRELVPARVIDYADQQMDTVVWKEMTQGRGTVPPGGF